MNIALIPARGGSKSIPFKNIKIMNGKPLIYWTIKAACECHYIHKVYVSTDSPIIRDTALAIREEHAFENSDKIEVVSRSEASSTDTASTEMVMLEFAKQHMFDNIVLIQATSPLLKAKDLNAGFEKLDNELTDSVLSVVRQKRFLWQLEGDSYTPINYDYQHRPRRQEFEGFLVENGAFYICSRQALIESKNRLNGKISIVEMPEESYYEIDEPSDWDIIQNIMKKENEMKVPKIKMLLSDCDGCLTDGGMYYSENGDELKRFNAKDGMAFQLLREKGIIIGMVTGEDRQLNQRRAEKLKMQIYVPGCKDKLGKVAQIAKDYNIHLENILFVGDDINDLEIMQKVGYSVCPNDAVDSIKNVANYVAATAGGQGVIREVVDHILKQNT